MALPANVSFGTVTGRFLTATADSPTDPDRDPEGTAATDLSIRFAPNLTPAVVRDASASPPTIFALAEVVATVGASGDLLGPDGQPGIRLVATTGATLDPSGWTWQVTLSSPTFPTLSFSFSLDGGQSIDLASVVQVPAGPGTTLAAWLQAVADARAARDAAQAAAASVPSAASLAATYLTQASAASAYATKASAASGGLSARTMVAIGDSICALNNGPALGPSTAVTPYNTWSSRGYLTWMQTLLGQRFNVISNAGIGGQRTDQMDTRFASDVVAYAPAWVDIEGGGNDISQGRTAAQIIASLTSMYGKAQAAGIKVLANTVLTSWSFAGATLTASAASGQNQIILNATPGAMTGDTVIVDTGTNAETLTVSSAPTSAPGALGSYTVTFSSNLTKAHAAGVAIYNVTKMQILAAVNAWIEAYWRNNPNGILANVNAAYADPVTGGPATGLALDGVHPSIDGAARLGKVKADAIDRFVPLESHGGGWSPGNLLGQAGGQVGTAGTFAAFTTGSGTGQVATGWTLFAGTGAETVVASKVARQDNVPGEWQQFVLTNGSTSFLSYNANNGNVGVDWAIGDAVWAEVEWQGDGDVQAPAGGNNGALVNVNLLPQNGAGNSAQAMQSASGTDGASTIWPATGWFRTNAIQVPTGTTRLYVQIQVRATAGTFRVGRVRLMKGSF